MDLRIGKISSVNPEKSTAQVTFEDRSGKVSGDLPVVVPCTLKDKFYYMPSIEERVLAVFDPDADSKGFIIGSFYADTRLPPVHGENKAYLRFEDGTALAYDKDSHTLDIEGAGLIVNINAGAEINISAKADISIKSQADINAESAGVVTVKSAAGINVISNSDISIASTENISIVADKGLLLKGQTDSLTL